MLSVVTSDSTFYKVINKIMNKSVDHHFIVKIWAHSKVASDPVDIINTLNKYFCKIGQLVLLKTYPTENALPKSKCSI